MSLPYSNDLKDKLLNDTDPFSDKNFLQYVLHKVKLEQS